MLGVSLLCCFITLALVGAGVGRANDVARILSEHRGETQLSRDTSEELMRAAKLGWRVERPVRGSTIGWGVLAVASTNGEFAVLAGSKYGEWGIYGPTAYALVRQSGAVAWSDSGAIFAIPLVSDGGVVVRFERANWEPGGSRRPYCARFFAADGRRIGEREWQTAALDRLDVTWFRRGAYSFWNDDSVLIFWNHQTDSARVESFYEILDFAGSLVASGSLPFDVGDIRFNSERLCVVEEGMGGIHVSDDSKRFRIARLANSGSLAWIHEERSLSRSSSSGFIPTDLVMDGSHGYIVRGADSATRIELESGASEVVPIDLTDFERWAASEDSQNRKIGRAWIARTPDAK